jgi:hypothetical protein
MEVEALDRTLRQGSCQGHDHAANAQDTQQGENPVRHILHENAHPVSGPDATRFETGGDPVGKAEHVGIGVFFDAVRMVEHECTTLRPTFRPILNPIKHPAADYCGVDRKTGNLGPCIHAPVE